MLINGRGRADVGPPVEMIGAGEAADDEEREHDKAHGVSAARVNQHPEAASKDELHACAEHEGAGDHSEADRRMGADQLVGMARQQREAGQGDEADRRELRDQPRRFAPQDQRPPRPGEPKAQTLEGETQAKTDQQQRAVVGADEKGGHDDDRAQERDDAEAIQRQLQTALRGP